MRHTHAVLIWSARFVEVIYGVFELPELFFVSFYFIKILLFQRERDVLFGAEVHHVLHFYTLFCFVVVNKSWGNGEFYWFN